MHARVLHQVFCTCRNSSSLLCSLPSTLMLQIYCTWQTPQASLAGAMEAQEVEACAARLVASAVEEVTMETKVRIGVRIRYATSDRTHARTHARKSGRIFPWTRCPCFDTSTTTTKALPRSLSLLTSSIYSFFFFILPPSPPSAHHLSLPWLVFFLPTHPVARAQNVPGKGQGWINNQCCKRRTALPWSLFVSLSASLCVSATLCLSKS